MRKDGNEGCLAKNNRGCVESCKKNPSEGQRTTKCRSSTVGTNLGEGLWTAGCDWIEWATMSLGGDWNWTERVELRDVGRNMTSSKQSSGWSLAGGWFAMGWYGLGVKVWRYGCLWVLLVCMRQCCSRRISITQRPFPLRFTSKRIRTAKVRSLSPEKLEL